MYATTSNRLPVRSADLRRDKGDLSIWLRTHGSVTLGFDPMELPGIIQALQACVDAAPSAPEEDGTHLVVEIP